MGARPYIGDDREESAVTVEPDPPQARVGTWDNLIEELHALRRSAGEPSYGELARRIAVRRMEDGASEHAARVAKSSVHDAFRMGRSRINVAFVRELVVALGEDPSAVDGWVGRCHAAEPAEQVPEIAGPAERTPAGHASSASRKHAVLLMAACVLLNLLGREFVDFLHLPIYLDMVGTAVVAVALGPWQGVLVGGTTNLVGAVGSGWVSIPFALVNVTGALVWGYGVRKFGMGRTLPRFFVLNLLAALACSVVAVPILLALYGQSFRDGHDAIMQIVGQSIHSFTVAAGFSNLLTSLADKLISGFGALVAVSFLPLALRSRLPLVLTAVPRDEAHR